MKFWEVYKDSLKCKACILECAISKGETGFCGNIVNRDNRLEAVHLPTGMGQEYIERLDVYHFWPGSIFYVVSGQKGPAPIPYRYYTKKLKPLPRAREISVKEAIKLSKKGNLRGICFVNPESSLPYAVDYIKEFAKGKFQTCVLSYGYLSLHSLKILLDAGLHCISMLHIPVSIEKETPWKVLSTALKYNVHVENSLLVVAGHNDTDAIFHEFSRLHRNYLGQDVPIHFVPDFSRKPTIDVLERAVKIARYHGIKYAYLSLRGHRYMNTICPSCGRIKIERYDTVVSSDIEEDHTCSCGEHIPVIGNVLIHKREFAKKAL